MEPEIRGNEERKDPQGRGGGERKGGKEQRATDRSDRGGRPFSSKSETKASGRAGASTDRGVGKSLKGALDMLISRYGNKPVLVERFDNYVLDLTGFSLLIQTTWSEMVSQDPSFPFNHRSSVFYYGCYLMLLKRVCTVRAGTVGANDLVFDLARRLPDIALPQPVSLYLDCLGSVKFEDGTHVVPDLIILMPFADGEANLYSRVVRLSDPDGPDVVEHVERAFPIWSCFLDLYTQAYPGELPADHFPCVGAAYAGQGVDYGQNPDIFSFINIHHGNYAFDANDFVDLGDGDTTLFGRVTLVTDALIAKIRDTMQECAIFTPLVMLSSALIGDISQCAITTFARNLTSAQHVHFRKSSGFSLIAATLFCFRRNRPPDQVAVPINANRFEGDYIKIQPPAPRVIADSDDYPRSLRTYVRAFFR